LAARGDSYDNALAGMISRLYKTELTPSIMHEPRDRWDDDPRHGCGVGHQRLFSSLDMLLAKANNNRSGDGGLT